MVRISSIEKNSPAEKKKIVAGEKLISINGNDIYDVLDYRYYQLETSLLLVIEAENGQQRNVKIRKDEYEEIGLEFETYLMDKQRSCKNKCIFCFIDQLPKGMRETLYFKDDDSRLSFLFGNYVTLTNLTQHEIARIIKMHISPINVSVHTTNPQLRVKMLGNKTAGDSLSLLEKFRQNGIDLNCQIVVCPGVNDGEELQKTLADLQKLEVNVCAVVPVGLTKHREGLYPLKPFSKQAAQEVLAIVQTAGDINFANTGRRVFYAADELYIKAEQEIPEFEFYEDFDALENGVGLIALFRQDAADALESIGGNAEFFKGTTTVVTGISAAPFLEEIAREITKKSPQTIINVQPITNEFFGEQVNVAGLICGCDIIKQLEGRELGDRLLIPGVMLRHGGDLFLDGISPKDISMQLGVAVEVAAPDGDGFVNTFVTE
ncbi:MAG: DUF512 domain-containing protein [Oscillospiraceae bacterium]|jgi:putative radical SAM enzyme (TIGR03279 family)|nr:DUF512 domain-containing protein [Oscillospiraceae bacterium]